MRKTERNEQLIEMYKTGNYSQVALASEFGITKERIRQIIRANILLTDRRKIKKLRKIKTWQKNKPK